MKKTYPKRKKREAGHRLIILSGPSCVGKSPLKHALTKLYPGLMRGLKPLVLYDDRLPRPGEKDGVDYHFRSRRYIQALRRKKDFLVLEVRGDLMAVDLRQLKEDLKECDVFYEGNPFVAGALSTHPALKATPKVSVFLSPLSAEELAFFKSSGEMDMAGLVTDMMRRKLLRRTQRQKGLLALSDLENIEIRANSAFKEMQTAWRFDHVLVNHDGEESDHWQAFYYPVGEARHTVMAFADIISGRRPVTEEHWDKDLLN